MNVDARDVASALERSLQQLTDSMNARMSYDERWRSTELANARHALSLAVQLRKLLVGMSTIEVVELSRRSLRCSCGFETHERSALEAHLAAAATSETNQRHAIER